MKTINITQEVHTILTTVQTLNGRLVPSYLNRLLRADDYRPIQEKHLALLTYGALEGMGEAALRNTINWVILNRFMAVSGGEYPSLWMTQKGEDALMQEQTLEVPAEEVPAATKDVPLMQLLQHYRRETAAERKIAPYLVFTDATLDAIVRQKPATLEEISQLPGMNDAKAQTYGEAILGIGQQYADDRKVAYQQQLARKAKSAKVQEVKALYESGMDVDAIAAHQNLKRSSVETYLETLHQTGQINLVTWVASHLNEQPALNMGVVYFRKWRDARLSDAQQALGLDYHTLRLCRWYALAA